MNQLTTEISNPPLLFVRSESSDTPPESSCGDKGAHQLVQVEGDGHLLLPCFVFTYLPQALNLKFMLQDYSRSFPSIFLSRSSQVLTVG